MSKAIRDIPKKRGRPKTTGRGDGVMVRLQPPQMSALDAWIARQREPVSRPEAIRRLVEAGLSAASSVTPFSEKTAARAAGMAERQIDRMSDQSVAPEVRQTRKRKLLKGPEEFRDLRAKQPRKRAKP